MPHANRLRLLAFLALAFLVTFAVDATRIEAATEKGYARANFAFGAPAKLKASVTGSTATLTFDKPVTQSPAAIKGALSGYVSGVTLSADKRTVTLALNKSYRLRQFTSGNNVGIDLIGEPASAAQVAAAEKRNATPKPVAKPVIPPPAKIVKPVAKPAAKPADDILTTKHTAPAPAPAAAEAPKPAAEKPATDTILTTKHAEPAPAPAPEPAKTETPAPATAPAAAEAPKPAAESTPATVKPPTVMPDEDTVDAPAKPSPATDHRPPAVVPEAEENHAPAPATDAKSSKGPLLVTAKTADGNTTINFPWTERTGAAVFKRTRNIWVVFSRPREINVATLRSVMPQQIVNVIQYKYDGNTVLEFVTDGSVHPAAAQVKGGFGWNITIGPNDGKPTTDTAITPDDLEGTTRLILGAYDIAPTVRFYDPDVGDELLIIPSFENGRAVFSERNFPELSILGTVQGIAIVARRHDITSNQTRAGLIIAAPGGLKISQNLPTIGATNAPNATGPSTTGVMIPYDEWAVPREKYVETMAARLHAVSKTTKAAKPDALFELVKLYLSAGQGTEATGVLDVIKSDYPDYYKANKLALLSAAAHVMQNHMPEATIDLQAPELATVDEAWPWREVVALSAPQVNTVQAIQQSVEASSTAPTKPTGNDSAKNLPGPVAPAPVAEKPQFHFLKYNKSYLRYYPPRIRQRLAQIAADAYLADGQEEKALAAFDTLLKDGIMDPVKLDANFALASVAEKKGETDKALAMYDDLAKQSADRYNAARGRAAAARLRYAKGKIGADEATEILESVRTTWRGDALERGILNQLISIYTDAKRYDEVLRTYRNILDGFPNDPNALTVATDMSDLFEHIFLDNLDSDMPPLKALSLFYEFREMTPLGDKGDKVIQQLADRLAAIDLLDRATQLLDNQIKFRVAGEQRSQIGARLALLHILNHKPQDALNVLETTNYGNNPVPLQIQRQELTAAALNKLNRNEEALGVITNDSTKNGNYLRLDILWAMQDWPNVVSHAEDILGARQNLTEPLSPTETEVLLKLALGYTFEGDTVQLRYLRDYYTNLIPDSGYKQIFEYITNDTTPLDPEDFNMIAKQISHTESFLDAFKTKIAAGKLSETIK